MTPEQFRAARATLGLENEAENLAPLGSKTRQKPGPENEAENLSEKIDTIFPMTLKTGELTR
jgi:hypothetical protein